MCTHTYLKHTISLKCYSNHGSVGWMGRMWEIRFLMPSTINLSWVLMLLIPICKHHSFAMHWRALQFITGLCLWSPHMWPLSIFPFIFILIVNVREVCWQTTVYIKPANICLECLYSETERRKVKWGMNFPLSRCGQNHLCLVWQEGWHCSVQLKIARMIGFLAEIRSTLTLPGSKSHLL